jgi:hypothetical protein
VAKKAAASADARPRQRMDDVRDMTTPSVLAYLSPQAWKGFESRRSNFK